MDNVDNKMNVKPPRADVNSGSQSSKKVEGTSAGASLGTQSSVVGGGDTVSFTSTAAEMLKLEESLANIPDIDNVRVASIKASIADGSYRIDPDKIVDTLLKLERDFR